MLCHNVLLLLAGLPSGTQLSAGVWTCHVQSCAISNGRALMQGLLGCNISSRSVVLISTSLKCRMWA